MRTGLAPIRVDEVYTLAEFQSRTGLGRAGVRAARRSGLIISACGRNRYVRGADWDAYLTSGRGEVRGASLLAGGEYAMAMEEEIP